MAAVGPSESMQISRGRVFLIRAACAAALIPAAQLATGAESASGRGPSGALRYEVIEGWAVHAGDIVLGRAGKTGAAEPGAPEEPALPDWRTARSQSIGTTVPLWNRGIVPYVIDGGFSEETRELILAAIQEWNDKTIITLVPRATERDYVRFQTTTERCRSHIGRMGGQQSIWWVSSGNACGGMTFLLHEIGHTVGLWHEHQRVDRNAYVTVRQEGLLEGGRDWVVPSDHPAEGPYDYASVMHYHPLVHSRDGLPVLETIPPGIPVRANGGPLSQGDIHRVARLYGRQRWATTITTNPPGLPLVINGKLTQTPSTYYWMHGITKSLSAPAMHEEDGTRYLFARWSSNRSRTHNFTVGLGGTWIEANYIVQHAVSATPHPAEGGSVTIEPPSPDGYYTLRTALTVRPSPDSEDGYQFWRWGLWRNHGFSSETANILVHGPDQFAAHFTKGPLFRVGSTVGPFMLFIDDTHQLGPVALHPSEHSDTVRVSVPAVQTRPSGTFGPSRYRFEGWTDGGPREREVSVAGGGEIVARFRTESYADSGSAQASGIGAGTGARAASHNVRGLAAGQGGAFGDEAPTHAEGVWSSSMATLFERAQQKLPTGAEALAAVPTEYSFPVLAGQEGFLVSAPPGARQLTIRFEPWSPGTADVLLAIKGNAAAPIGEPETTFGFGGPNPGLEALAAGRAIVLSAHSTPPLEAARTYGIRLVSPEDLSGVAGRVRVRVESGALPARSQVSPRALTFVAPTFADAPLQEVTLTNPGPDMLRFHLTGGTPWLSAEPTDGVIQPYGQADISVRTHSAGMLPETYKRGLHIELMDPAGKHVGGHSVKVAFAVVQASRQER